MRIIVDSFGGDNAPLEIIKGCYDAVSEFGVEITLVGKEDVIRRVCTEQGVRPEIFEILNADDVITNDDNGSDIVKSKSESSMAVGLKYLHEGGGDAFISAGNSGAICVGATLIVKRIKGISRPGFAAVMPSGKGKMILLDCGANLQVRPEMLRQFALMGSVYMENVMGVENPRVSIANVGTEEHKGTELQQEAYSLLKNSDLNFIGYIEGRDIPEGKSDVVVCDGFTGNMILKTYEGVALTLMKKFKGVFTKSLKNKLAAALVLKDMKVLKKDFDYAEIGGAPILGVQKPVFKAHGNADSRSFKNGIRQIMLYHESGVVDIITEKLKEIKAGEQND